MVSAWERLFEKWINAIYILLFTRYVHLVVVAVVENIFIVRFSE